ncbi:MAG: Fe-S protein assembly chaperone HscA [Bacteroidia bacterium]|nr:Fe-S protein assembly chaperone HscA [Bacteroidia bacterium]MDW8346967.1 Fe-S protein assembly chaperone HscA [Bacteroidia bacterium]
MAKISIDIKTGTIKKQKVIVGIDLGTTNSLIAYTKDGHPVAVRAQNNQTIVPSIIHFTEQGEILVGHEAKPYLISSPERTIYSVKRLMGKSYKDIASHSDFFTYKIIDDNTDHLVKVRVGDKFYNPIELSSHILKALKNAAEKELNVEINQAVITVPAYFNDSQRQATKDAGKLAGLEVLRIINEPTAASLAYGIGLNKDEVKTIAVYDLGGGTFDISILRIENGVFEVLSTNGDTYLGGDDLDKALAQYWIGTNNLPYSKVKDDKNFLQSLRLEAEQAKKVLSTEHSYQNTITWGDKSIHCYITRNGFEKIISPIIEKTIQCCKNAVQDAHISIEQIDAVVMVGGSTRVPFVKQTVKQFFNREPYDEINPDEVVALGAAIEADILSGNRKDIILLDVTPLSLGIETLGGLMDVLIPRNTKIPTQASRQYTTSIDGQTNLKISVYQGERELVKDNRKLAEFDLKGIPPMPAGLPKIQINFTLNADGILKVTAKELRSGIQQDIEVKPQYGLTDEQVEQMLLASLQNAQQDMQERQILEAIGEADQILYHTQKFIQKHADLITEQEKENTQKSILHLQDALKTRDKNLIYKAIDELNEVTKPFAERAMDIAIAEALKGKKI